MRNKFFPMSLLVFLWSCQTAPSTTLPYHHPANSQAQEAPFQKPADLFAQSIFSAAKEKQEDQGVANSMYSCPMHPEVQSENPGNCPKCGMTLRPLKADHNSESKK